eukprot:g3527.t1
MFRKLLSISALQNTCRQVQTRYISTQPRVIQAVPLSTPMEFAKPNRLLALNTLSDNPGARKPARRVGRGIGSSKGKTAGRGHKGQGQRNRRAKRPGFEGGQMPLQKRQPKRGFNQSYFARPMKELNLNKLQKFIDSGRIDPSKTITMKELHDCNIVGKIKYGVKLLAGERDELSKLKTPITIEVSRASRSAIEAVESVGGRITTTYYNELGIRALTRPDAFVKKGRQLPQRARPRPKIMPYYTSFENRGYLSPEMLLTAPPFVPEGQYGCPKKMREKIHPELSSQVESL